MSVTADTQRAVVQWLAGARTGTSSMTMAFWLAFATKYQHSSHPYDPADFDRCLGLLDAAPELRAQLPAMRGVSETWARLVDRWDDIEAMHLDEVGLGWTKADRAPRTYALMKSVLDTKQTEAAR
jgi:hypothetical protein